jgi:hypothetical protein
VARVDGIHSSEFGGVCYAHLCAHDVGGKMVFLSALERYQHRNGSNETQHRWAHKCLRRL